MRAWQARAVREWVAVRPENATWVAAPGSGKTLAAARLGHGLLRAGHVNRIITVVPRLHLKRQISRTYGRVGIPVEHRWQGERWPADALGVAVTYQQVAADPERMAAYAADALVLLDEVHHAGADAAWGKALYAAFERAPYRLSLSGTPVRTDRTPIPFVEYDHLGRYRADIVYGYADAVAEGVCRPLVFVLGDGAARWRTNDGEEVEASFTEAGRLTANRRRELMRTQLELGMHGLIERANRALLRLRAEEAPDAAALLVARDQDHARRMAGLVYAITGERPELVISDEEGADRALEAFSRGRGSWVVSVHMVSEGVDIPRLRVGVFASAVTTELYFRQFCGRLVRGATERAEGQGYVYLPAEPALVSHAREIRAELKGVVVRPNVRATIPVPQEPHARELGQYEALYAGLAVVASVHGEEPSDQERQETRESSIAAGTTTGTDKVALQAEVVELVRRVCRATGQEPRAIHGRLKARFGDDLRGATLWTLQGRIAELRDWLKAAHSAAS